MPWHLHFLLSCPVSSFLTHVLVNCPSILTQALTLSSLWGALLHLIQLLWLTVITLSWPFTYTVPLPMPTASMTFHFQQPQWIPPCWDTICGAHTPWFTVATEDFGTEPSLTSLLSSFNRSLQQVPESCLVFSYYFKHPFIQSKHPDMILAPTQQRSAPKTILLPWLDEHLQLFKGS